jgi:cell division control protein 6
MYSKIFKPGGKQYLDFMFVPPKIPHREEELRILVENIRPALEGDTNSYTIPIIYGRTGTGKTTVAKKLLEILDELDVDIVLNKVMVNCVSYSRPYNLSQFITQSITEIPTRGYSYQELMQIAYDTLELRDEYLLLILDDVDELIRSDKGRFLHLLTRIEEVSDRRRILPLLIARKIEGINDLPSHIRNKLNGPVLHFKPYTTEEMEDIVDDRVELAINDGCISQNSVSAIAYISSVLEGGDARTALILLLNSGKIAELENSDMIIVEHVRKAYEHIPGYSFHPISSYIDNRTRYVLEVSLEYFSRDKDRYAFDEEMMRAIRSAIAKRYGITLSNNDLKEVLDRLVETRFLSKYDENYMWIVISVDTMVNLLAEYFK